MKKDEVHVTVDKNLSILIDFFRWFSALLVVLSHSRSIFFVPWRDVADKGIVNKLLYAISASADYGVLMFFALSGYLIGGGVLVKMKKKKFQIMPYLINRFSRIYIVLFPALLFIWCFDATGMAYLNGLGIYTKAYDIGALEYSTQASLTAKGFLLNLLMMQNIAAPPFGTANQLWSLNWEWFAYLLAPVLIGMYLKFPKRYLAVVFAALAVLIMSAWAGFLLLWMLGILLGLIRFRSKLALIASACACTALPVATRAHLLPASLWTQAAFLSCFIVLLSQLKHVRLPKAFTRIPHKVLASFSYSLYIIHTTILMFVMACLQTFVQFPAQSQPRGISYLYYAVFIVIAYFISYAFAHMTEYHTSALRQWIAARLKPFNIAGTFAS